VAPPPPAPCVSPAKYLTTCGVMIDPMNSVFETCLSALGPSVAATLYAGCLLDACHTDGRSLCLSIKNLVDECAQIGVPIPCGKWQQLPGCGELNYSDVYVMDDC